MANKKNWKIISVEDFVIFKASDDIIEEANRKYAEANESNRRWLETHPAVVPPVPITGTFICAQPPNYRGVPMLHATVEDWETGTTWVDADGDGIVDPGELTGNDQEVNLPENL